MELVIKDRLSGTTVKVTVEAVAGQPREVGAMLDHVTSDLFDGGLDFWWNEVKEIELIRDGVVVPDDERDPDHPNNRS